VFVLHDVFRFPFEDVAEIVGRTPAASRQLASRARRRIQDETGPGRFQAGTAEHHQIAEGFIAACAGGDLEGLMKLLDPDVVGHVDPRTQQSGAPPTARKRHRWTRNPRILRPLVRLHPRVSSGQRSAGRPGLSRSSASGSDRIQGSRRPDLRHSRRGRSEEVRSALTPTFLRGTSTQWVRPRKRRASTAGRTRTLGRRAHQRGSAPPLRHPGLRVRRRSSHPHCKRRIRAR
jgi:hypothetical protein